MCRRYSVCGKGIVYLIMDSTKFSISSTTIDVISICAICKCLNYLFSLINTCVEIELRY